MQDEIHYQACKHCDYLKIDLPIAHKKPKCGLSSSGRCMECDVYLTTERLKSRINYLNGKIGPLFACGTNGFIDTFMQQLPADESKKDIQRRKELMTQTTLLDD